MKKVIATTMAAFLVAQVASAVSASVDFASAYVFRGETINDGFVIQPSLESEVAGLTVGVWANVDVDNVGADQVSEIDLYVGKGLGSVAGWDISAGYCEYTYPGVDGDGESELSISAAGSISGVDLSVTAFANIAETSTPGYYEVATGGATALAGVALDYGVTLGYEDGAEAGFGFAAYTVSYETGGGTLSVTYIDELDDAITTVGESVFFAYSLGL